MRSRILLANRVATQREAGIYVRLGNLVHTVAGLRSCDQTSISKDTECRVLENIQ